MSDNTTPRYSIAEASDILKVSHRTMHHYEETIGLSIARSSSGVRVYSERDIEIYDMIIRLKDEGLSLNSIRKQLINRNVIDPAEQNKGIMRIDEGSEALAEYFVSELRTALSQVLQEGIGELTERMEGLQEENHCLRDKLDQMQQENSAQFDAAQKEYMEKLTAMEEKITELYDSHKKAQEEQPEKQSWIKRLLGK